MNSYRPLNAHWKIDDLDGEIMWREDMNRIMWMPSDFGSWFIVSKGASSKNLPKNWTVQ